MSFLRLALTIAALSLALAACGQSNDQSKATSSTPSAPATTAAPEAKKEVHEAPDTHGMPGMSELFKGKDEKK